MTEYFSSGRHEFYKIIFFMKAFLRILDQQCLHIFEIGWCNSFDIDNLTSCETTSVHKLLPMRAPLTPTFVFESIAQLIISKIAWVIFDLTWSKNQRFQKSGRTQRIDWFPKDAQTSSKEGIEMRHLKRDVKWTHEERSGRLDDQRIHLQYRSILPRVEVRVFLSQGRHLVRLR